MLDKIMKLKKKANEIRCSVMDMCVAAGTGHVTSSFSCAEILVALYHGGILNHDARSPRRKNRDRFILSKGQASPILYAVLADAGFFPRRAFGKFFAADGMFGVHLQNDVPGVEITSGSLGHGLGIGAGMSLAAKMDNKSHLTFVLLGDGECHEGSVWEAAMFISHNRLDNLVAIVDRNWHCVTGCTEDIVKLDPLDEKWRSFGWDAVTIDGHSFEQIFSSMSEVRRRKNGQPLVIIANTVKGKGVSFMENKYYWHGLAPKGKEAEAAKRELSERVCI